MTLTSKPPAQRTEWPYGLALQPRPGPAQRADSRGERATHNLVRQHHNEVLVAPDTRYGLVAHLGKSGARVYMHLLLRFTVCAFNGHNKVALASPCFNLPPLARGIPPSIFSAWLSPP